MGTPTESAEALRKAAAQAEANARRAKRVVDSAYHDFLHTDASEPSDALLRDAAQKAETAKECWARYVRFAAELAVRR